MPGRKDGNLAGSDTHAQCDDAPTPVADCGEKWKLFFQNAPEISAFLAPSMLIAKTAYFFKLDFTPKKIFVRGKFPLKVVSAECS
jgi:hypothetical protein